MTTRQAILLPLAVFVTLLTSTQDSNAKLPRCQQTRTVAYKALPLAIRNVPKTRPNGWFGKDDLWVILPKGSWARADSNGTYGLKMGWYRLSKGQMHLRAELVDGSKVASPHVPGGYPETGWQATGLDFPSVGCWRVTGSLGNTQVAFVIAIG